MAKRPSWLSCLSTPPVHGDAALNRSRTILPLRGRRTTAAKGTHGPEPDLVETKFVEPRSFRHQGRAKKH